MHLFRACFIIYILLLLTSCDKEAAEQPVISSIKEPPVITGIAMRDISGNAIGVIGSPNTNIGQGPYGFKIMAYPNPCKHVLNLAIYADKAGEAKIWIVGGKYDGASNNLGLQALYDSNVNVESWYYMLTAGGNVTSIDVSNMPDGYYRLNVDMGGTTYWDNIWINKTEL